MIWTKLDYKTVSGQDVWQLATEDSAVVITAVEGHPELDKFLAQLEAE